MWVSFFATHLRRAPADVLLQLSLLPLVRLGGGGEALEGEDASGPREIGRHLHQPEEGVVLHAAAPQVLAGLPGRGLEAVRALLILRKKSLWLGGAKLGGVGTRSRVYGSLREETLFMLGSCESFIDSNIYCNNTFTF